MGHTGIRFAVGRIIRKIRGVVDLINTATRFGYGDGHLCMYMVEVSNRHQSFAYPFLVGNNKDPAEEH